MEKLNLFNKSNSIMSIDVRDAGKLLIVIPNEQKLHLQAADEMKSLIFDFIEKGQKRFLVNFNNVDLIDTAGLGVLINIGQRLQIVSEGSLSFCNVSNPLMDIFEIINLKQFFQIYSDEKSAIEAIVSQELKQKRVAYVGSNESDYIALKKMGTQQILLEKFQLIDSNSDAYIIEEGNYQTNSLNDKPFILLTNSPKTIQELIEIKSRTDASHIVERPITENEAKYMLSELIQYQPVVSNDAALQMSRHLFDQYSKSIPEKLLQIEQLIEESKSPSREKIEALKSAIHKLSGSAGTYGYVKAGEACKHLEQKLTLSLNDNLFGEDLLDHIRNSFKQIKFYFFATFFKDLSKRNVAVRPIQSRSAFVVSSDRSVINLFNTLASELNLRMAIETDPERVIQHLKDLDFKPEIIVVESRLNHRTIDGLDLIKTIKNSLLATGIKFGLLVEDDNFEINMRAAIDGVRFIIKKPISSKDINAIFKSLSATQITKPYKVLVVDDDIDICNFIKSAFQSDHIQIQATTDEKKILEYLYEFRPNLLLLDINLKNYDGWSVLSTLRKDLRYQDLKTIIITSTADPEALKRLHSDCDDVWVKPLDKIQLQNNILQLAEANASTLTETKLASFKSTAEFKKLLLTLTTIGKQQTRPFVLVVFGALEYPAVVQAGGGAEEEYLISSENLFTGLIKGDCLRGYLEKGRFGFLFCDHDAGELTAELERIARELDFKIMLNGRIEDIFITFTEVIKIFKPGEINVDELLGQTLDDFERKLEVHQG